MKTLELDLTHANDCWELDKLTLEGIWSLKQWEKELLEPYRVCIGIFSSNTLLSMCCGWLVLEELQLTVIAVHPEYRRQGLAKLVLKTLLNKAHKAGASYATLEVATDNQQAIKLYESLGFQTTGFRRNYYKNSSDALIQSLSLKQRPSVNYKK